MIISSFYRYGSDGWVNLFERDGKFVVQWEGTPSYDSGYAAQEFDTLAEAQTWFDEELAVENMRHAGRYPAISFT